MELKYSFPKIDKFILEKAESILYDKFQYSQLPEDYKSFLLSHNGWFVSPGYIDDTDESEHTFEFVFDTPLKWAKNNDKTVSPCIIMFFGIFLNEFMNNEVNNEHQLYELIRSNEHSRNNFNILPNNMISFAKCSHPDCDDLLAISLENDEYGSIYFYYGMWHYPNKWHGDYYENKTKDILVKYDFESIDDIDTNTEIGLIIQNELKKVPFVKVANSFTDFIDNCKISNDN